MLSNKKKPENPIENGKKSVAIARNMVYNTNVALHEEAFYALL